MAIQNKIYEYFWTREVCGIFVNEGDLGFLEGDWSKTMICLDEGNSLMTTTCINGRYIYIPKNICGRIICFYHNLYTACR